LKTGTGVREVGVSESLKNLMSTETFSGFGIKTSAYDVARIYHYPITAKAKLAYYYLRQD
jgi:hypothetical protein